MENAARPFFSRLSNPMKQDEVGRLCACETTASWRYEGKKSSRTATGGFYEYVDITVMFRRVRSE